MKRPLPNKYILYDFLKTIIKQTLILGVFGFIFYHLRFYLNENPISDQKWLIFSFTLLITSLCLLFFMKRKKCTSCKKILFDRSAYCHHCGQKTECKPNEPHKHKQELSTEEIKAYLEGALASGSIKGFFLISSAFINLIPFVFAYFFDFRYLLLFIPCIFFTLFVLRPLNYIFWKSCPYCADSTLLIDGRYIYKILQYCSNCGNPLAQRKGASR